jgi:hypothetical protein
LTLDDENGIAKVACSGKIAEMLLSMSTMSADEIVKTISCGQNNNQPVIRTA